MGGGQSLALGSVVVVAAEAFLVCCLLLAVVKLIGDSCSELSMYCIDVLGDPLLAAFEDEEAMEKPLAAVCPKPAAVAEEWPLPEKEPAVALSLVAAVALLDEPAAAAKLVMIIVFAEEAARPPKKLAEVEAVGASWSLVVFVDSSGSEPPPAECVSISL